jgi:hypothetical protein
MIEIIQGWCPYSSAGASSTSPEEILKQAESCQSLHVLSYIQTRRGSIVFRLYLDSCLPSKSMKLTSMPRASQSSITADHTLHKRGTIMCAIWAGGMYSSLALDKEDFAALDALNFCFSLLAFFEVKRREALELVFLDVCHDAGSADECTGCEVLFERLKERFWEAGS